MLLRKKNLSLLLKELFPAEEKALYSAYKDIKISAHLALLEDVYKELGGLGDKIPFTNEHPELSYNGLIIELDEELQFNRYRAITLRSPLYDVMPWFPAANYKLYCRRYESECTKAGLAFGKWSSPSAETFFGKSSEGGEFFGNGSAEWKLKAFTAFVNDFTPLCRKEKLLRLSIYDELLLSGSRISLGKILLSPKKEHVPGFLKFMERRITALNIS